MIRRFAAPLIVLLVAAGCGSSSKSSSSTASNNAASATSAPAAAGVTISSANLPGLGNVLVNGKGMTLYILSSEKGGTITCTDANGCTKVWPDNELPAGVTSATAGSGAEASLLGTATNAKGDHYVTYGGYPLYTFSHDSATGDAKGQGITSFGGTWWVMSVTGTPLTATSGSTPTTAKSSGYGY